MAGKSYQEEPGDDIRESIWETGRLSALQMFRVAAWKSARGLPSLTLNTEDAIATRTAAAMSAIASWRDRNVLKEEVDWGVWRSAAATAIGSKADRTGLLGLEGFGYPMASAFLSFLVPTAFPVIDRWTVEAVYGANIVKKTGVWHRSRVYAHFAQELVERQDLFADAQNIHRVDQTVMNRAMACRHSERPCVCYPSWPVDPPKA
ncbi:hypothetical protein [Mycobacterium sp. 852002-51971_SCH5477799-a]|uniref:hypothetical protein n=1 Tax=Mycobacterium sp. 852002-51971_SCH5477799-a TaxID=1834106 RepID=UPI0012E77BF3|nr:hypothetical protein [Mycobacterium sp. 852002-51971_SCH5477799-a]